MRSNDVCFTKKNKQKKNIICAFECTQTQSFNVALTLKGLRTWKLRPKDVENYTQRVFENTKIL